MANSIVPFDFNGFEIRTLGNWENPLFVAKDICKALDLDDVSKACAGLDDDEKGTNTVLTPGGNQDLVCITESGLYSLVLRSRKPQAKAFKKWITSEVIPSIRKTGGYIKPMSPAEILIQQGQMMLAIEQRQEALDLENQRLRLEQNQIKAEQNLLQETVLEHDAEIGRLFQPDGMLMSLAGTLNLHGKSATAAQLSSVGKKAAKVHREKYGKDPEMIGDARYGKVFVYPKAIAEQVLSEAGYI